MNRFVSAVSWPTCGGRRRLSNILFLAGFSVGLACLAPMAAEADAGPVQAGEAGRMSRADRSDRLALSRGEGAVDASLAVQLPPAGGLEALGKLFEARRQALAAGDAEAALEREQEIAALRDDLGIDNLFSFSTALLAEARALLGKDPVDARHKALLAAALSPSLPQSRWIALAAAWRARQATGATLGALAREAWTAVQVSLREPYVRAARHMDWLLLAPLVALGVTFAVLAVCFARAARYLLHDLSHLMPRGVGKTSILLLVLALAALTWLSGFGLFGPLAALGFLLIPYASASERAALALGVLAMAALPLLARAVGERQPFLDADAQLLYAIDRGGPEGSYLAAQEARLAEQAEHSYAASYVLGRKAVRLGDYARAIPLLRQATRLNQSAPEPWIALGNAHLCSGDLERAFENYTRARQHAPQSAEAAFNLSGLYLRQAQLAPDQEQAKRMLGLSKSMLDEAVQLSPALARATLDMRANRFVLTPPLDLQALSKSARQPLLARDLSAQVTRLFFGDRAPGWSLKAALTALALWLVYGLGRRLVPVSRPCFKCGAPTCTRCEQRSPSPGLCAPCFGVFGQQGRLDSTACAQREWQIQRALKWRARAILASALLIPCSGALWRGKALRGALGLACCALAIALIAFPQGFYPAPFAASPPLFKRLPAIALLALLWSQSLLATHRALRARLQRQPQPLGKLP